MAGVWMKTIDEGEAAAAPLVEAEGEVLRLFREHGAPLYRFCRCTLARGDEAEDVVQDVFLKLLQHLRRGGGGANLRAWLFQVAANGCRDRLRGRDRWLPWRADRDRRIAGPAAEEPDRRGALAALGALGPRDRLLLSLRAQGLSYREIASAAGIRERSVGRLLARAVDRWKKRIEG